MVQTTRPRGRPGFVSSRRINEPIGIRQPPDIDRKLIDPGIHIFPSRHAPDTVVAIFGRNGQGDFAHFGTVEQLAIAVGTAQTPTPLGEYYVFERLSVAIASGPYGPGALGLSAFSPVLTGWTRGGPIAIHGTRDPTSIGHDASNGCVRVANRPMKRLLRQIPAGTPVQIVD